MVHDLKLRKLPLESNKGEIFIKKLWIEIKKKKIRQKREKRNNSAVCYCIDRLFFPIDIFHCLQMKEIWYKNLFHISNYKDVHYKFILIQFHICSNLYFCISFVIFTIWFGHHLTTKTFNLSFIKKKKKLQDMSFR